MAPHCCGAIVDTAENLTREIHGDDYRKMVPSCGDLRFEAALQAANDGDCLALFKASQAISRKNKTSKFVRKLIPHVCWSAAYVDKPGA